MARHFSLIVFLGFLLSACTAEPDVTRNVPIDQFAYADQFLKQIRSGSVDGALAQLDPSINLEQARPIFQNFSDNFPKQTVRETRVVQWSEIFQNKDGTVSTVSSGQPDEQSRIQMVLRYIFSDTDALDALVVLGRNEQSYYVTFLNFRPMGQADIDASSFLAPGKSILHFLYFLAGIAILSFILVTLYNCVRAPAPRWRWRWLWVIFILLSIGRFTMIWTTGDMQISPLPVLFGVEFKKLGLYGPWVFHIGIPFGAIAWWIYRWRKRKQKPALSQPEQSVAS